MQDINLKVLIDKALDVDPDLRFMALEDYRKYLETSKPQPSNVGGYNAIEGFVPTLFRLLQDHNSDVQSQAIKSFAPTVRHLNSEATLKIIDQLYALILQENAKSRDKGQFKSFTTSIPNMALRSILDTSSEHSESSEDSRNGGASTKFDSKLARATIDRLLPQLIKNDITYDSIEILIDLIRNLGLALNGDELYNLSLFLIEISFKEAGIISKRSIVGFGLLFKYVTREQDLNNSIRSIHNHDLKQGSRDTIIIKSQLYSVLLNCPLLIEPELLSEIFKEITVNLKLSQNFNPDEDLDYDKVLEDNLIREDSLTVLNNLIRSKNNIQQHESKIFDIIKFFITYNPFKSDDDDEEMVDFDDDDKEIEFSDEENDAEADDDDDGSWKLRMRSCIVLRSFANKFPQNLDSIYLHVFNQIPIDDKNELVFNEAIKAAIHIIDHTSQKHGESFDLIEKKIIGRLFVNERKDHFSKVLKLIESLNKFNEKQLIEQTFAKFEELHIVTDGSLSYLNFYRNVLEISAKEDPISDSILAYIFGDLIKSLENKSFNVIIESIKISSLLFGNVNNKRLSEEQVGQIAKSLISKIENNKIYSSDLVQLSIQSLGQLLLNNLLDDYLDLTEVFIKSLSGETTIRVTLETLIELSSVKHQIFNQEEFRNTIFEKTNELLLSRDESVQALAMTLVCHLSNFGAIESATKDSLYINLIGLLKDPEASVFNDQYNVFEALTLLHKDQAFVDIEAQSISHSMITLVNLGKIDYENKCFYQLISLLTHNYAASFDIFKKDMDLGREISSKILAIISVENNLIHKIVEYEEFLLSLLKDKSLRDVNTADLIFAIQFLGNVGESLPLKSVTFVDLLQLLNEPEEDFKPIKAEETKVNHEDGIKRAASTSIGRLVKLNVNSDFERLLSHYQDPAFERSRSYLVQSFKIFLSQLSEIHLEILWKAVWSVLRNLAFDHALCGELRNSGDLLSDIILRKDHFLKEVITSSEKELINFDESGPSPNDLVLIYTTGVISKKLLNELPASEKTADVLTSLVKLSVQWITVLNIDIKQLIIGNFLTGLHSQPKLILENLKTYILPSVFDQLRAQPEFKKIIPMGPYKFVIDEGLEIRKLCYEFLYTLISLEASQLETSSIDLHETLVNIVDQGLKDEQNDIIVLSCLNIINFVTNHEETFKASIIENGGLISNSIIANIEVQLNKKLSAKASSQDVESYEEKTKSIIRLSKQIFQVVHAYDDLNDQKLVHDWNKLILDIKGRFATLYNE